MSDQPMKGDYVLATKWSNGEAWDHWAVGFYNGQAVGFYNGHRSNRHYVLDAQGTQISANGFRRVAKITQEFGMWLLTNAGALEANGADLWRLKVLYESHPVRFLCDSYMKGGSDE